MGWTYWPKYIITEGATDPCPDCSGYGSLATEGPLVAAGEPWNHGRKARKYIRMLCGHIQRMFMMLAWLGTRFLVYQFKRNFRHFHTKVPLGNVIWRQLTVFAHRIRRTWFRRIFCENLLERTWAQIEVFLSRFHVCLICATKIILCISNIWVFFLYSPCERRKQVWLDQNYSNLLKIKIIWSRPEDQGFCVC